MEQSEAFKKGRATLAILEAGLAICENINQLSEQTAREVEQEIEEYFAKCFNALAARKAELLREVNQQINSYKKSVEDSSAVLVSSFEACKQTMHAASLMYPINPNNAEHIVEGLKNVTIPNNLDVRIFSELPSSFLQTIQQLGQVKLSSSLVAPAKMVTVGAITTFVGSIAGIANGKGSKARFSYPWGICINPFDNCLYVCDSSNDSIRKVTIQGEVSTFASGLNGPTGIVMNHAEKSFFVVNNTGSTIAKISGTGVTSAFAGSGQKGIANGRGIKASFHNPTSIAIDQETGNLFVTESGTHRIRKITPQGDVSTLVGSYKGFADGSNALFDWPCGICFDTNSKSLIVCDSKNQRLRRVQLNGDTTTLCELEFKPLAVTCTNGSIYVSSSSQLFTMIQQGQNYEPSVIAGIEGKFGKVDGKPELCTFNGAYGIVVHESSNSLFVSDFDNHVIRKLAFK